MPMYSFCLFPLSYHVGFEAKRDVKICTFEEIVSLPETIMCFVQIKYRMSKSIHQKQNRELISPWSLVQSLSPRSKIIYMCAVKAYIEDQRNVNRYQDTPKGNPFGGDGGESVSTCNNFVLYLNELPDEQSSSLIIEQEIHNHLVDRFNPSRFQLPAL